MGYPVGQLLAELRADIDHYLEVSALYVGDDVTLRRRIAALLTPSVGCCLIHRLAHLFQRTGLRRPALLLAWLNQRLFGITIAPASRIGGGLYVAHPVGVVIQGHTGRRCGFFAIATLSPRRPSSCLQFDDALAPRLGDDVTLGAKSVVQGAIRIGSGTRIGQNCRIDQDLPARTITVSEKVRNRVEAT